MKEITIKGQNWVDTKSLESHIKDIIEQKELLPITSYDGIIVLWHVEFMGEGYNTKNIKALHTPDTLITIARVWNEVDGFVPDFTDGGQRKWFPQFVYDSGVGGFTFAFSESIGVNSNSDFEMLTCFATKERAAQFGELFIELMNEYILNK